MKTLLPPRSLIGLLFAILLPLSVLGAASCASSSASAYRSVSDVSQQVLGALLDVAAAAPQIQALPGGVQAVSAGADLVDAWQQADEQAFNAIVPCAAAALRQVSTVVSMNGNERLSTKLAGVANVLQSLDNTASCSPPSGTPVPVPSPSLSPSPAAQPAPPSGTPAPAPVPVPSPSPAAQSAPDAGPSAPATHAT